MADNWAERLQIATQPVQAGAAPAASWADRLMPTPADPSSDYVPGNLQFGPFDTGIHLSQRAENFLAGAGKALSDTGRGIMQKTGFGDSGADVAERNRRDAPLMDTSAGRWGNAGGQLATSLPLMWVPGASTLGGSAAAGAVYNALQPATGVGDWVKNTVEGGVGGTVGNVAGRALSAGAGLVKSTVAPFFQSGKRGIMADIFNSFEPDAQRALAGLHGNATPIVPGSFPTAGEAANTVGVSRLEKAVKQASPSAGQGFLDRSNAQNAARTAALNQLAGGEGKYMALKTARGDIANDMYSQARINGIDPAALTPEAQANIAAFQRRMAADPSIAARAQQIAGLSGQPIDNSTSLDGMHWALQGLRSRMNETANDPALSGAYKSLFGDLREGLGNISPMYGKANEVYAAMSQPLNAMEVGQQLRNKLVPALNDFGASGGLNASTYTSALRNGDAIAQQVTGQPRATLASVMGPNNSMTLDAVGADLARTANNRLNGAAAGSDSMQNALSQNIINSVLGPLGAPASWGTNSLLQTLLRPAQYAGSLAQHDIMHQLGHTLLSPEETAALARQALSRANSPRLMGDTLKRLGTAVGGGSAAALSFNPGE